MKKRKFFALCLLAGLFPLAGIHAQWGGFTGPGAFPQAGENGSFGPGGFTGGGIQNLTVAQASGFPNKTPVILTGNIVAFLGGDRYMFQDASGQMQIKIKRDRWWGVTAGPDDRVEIAGEFKRDKKNPWSFHTDVKFIRRI